MSALDILAQLKGLDFRTLPSLQRILLITDGTLTEILEAHFLEPIELIKLSQKDVELEKKEHFAELGQEEHLLERKILLRGAQSQKLFAYAESVISVSRLETRFGTDLRMTDIPLGRLWLEHRLETFKEARELGFEVSQAAASSLGRPLHDPLLRRSYRVYSDTLVVMKIIEYFPIHHD